MIICAISELPELGEPCIVPDTATGELEELEAVFMQEDPDTARTMGTERCVHVYFAELMESNNPYIAPNKQKYCTIRTFA